ncbi:hypothetical protein JYU20_00390 [Bacteroidales bacterium AH-315-I05]|nr:hypothetical protein [Bacteroidales bacterium AH-315-I05]
MNRLNEYDLYCFSLWWSRQWHGFEQWFNKHFGWFFTNGRKASEQAEKSKIRKIK